jgi:hypothetical protein
LSSFPLFPLRLAALREFFSFAFERSAAAATASRLSLG